MVRAVLDTNVFVSLLLASRGAGAWLMALWSERRYELVISAELFAELVEVLNRPEIKARVDLQRKLALFRRLRYEAMWTVGGVVVTGALADPDDDFLIGAAQEAGAEFLVTWDQRLLEQRQSEGVKIVTPDEFIAFVIRNQTES
jgi:uncharacterized protein